MNQLDKLLILLFLCFSFTVFGQSKQVKKANELYKLNRYSEAIPLYEQALKKKTSTSVKTKLANCYRFLNKTDKAELLYAEVVEKPHIKSKVYLFYGETLMSNGKYAQAKSWFQKYSELEPEDEIGSFYVKACDQVKYIQPYFTDVKVKPFTQNSEFDDTAPVFAHNSIVFASDREQGMKILKQKSSMTGRDFIRVYACTQNPDGTFEPAKPFTNKINELNKNTGPITFTADGKLAIFSSNAKEPNKKDIYPMQLYSAETHDGSKWKNVKLLSINRTGSNYMHPAISPDGNMLFFVSDKGNGVGGTDLYYCERTKSGWGKPQNLGPFINTSSNEGFPFFSADGKLYFSSKGHFGYGGYDVFFTEMNEKGSWKKPVNVGKPINSSRDDISIYVFEGQEKGFFTSSREGGDDDIFLFEKATNVQEAPESELTFLSLPDEQADNTDPANEPAKEPGHEVASTTNPQNVSPEELAIPQPIKTEAETVEEVAEEPAFYIEADKEEVITESGKPLHEVAEPIKPDEAVYIEQDEPFGDELIEEQIAEESPTQQQAPANSMYETTSETANPETPAVVADMVKEEEAAEEDFVETIHQLESANPVEKQLSESVEEVEEEDALAASPVAPPSAEPAKEEIIEPTEREAVHFPVEPPPTETQPNSSPDTAEPIKTDIHLGDRIVAAPEPVEELTPYEEIATPRPSTTYSLMTYDDLHFALAENRMGIGQTFKLPNIQFNFNAFDYSITPEIAQQLDNLADVLRAYPGLRIEVGGYTESYGEDQVNLLLSRQRAEAAVRYLIQQGIDSGRLASRGYGETKPLNHCVNGVLCSRDQHMENQRLEIKVLRQ